MGDYKIHFLLNCYVSLGKNKGICLRKYHPAHFVGGLSVLTGHGCTYCIKLPKCEKELISSSNFFPIMGTALAHGHRSHSFLKHRWVKNSILNSMSPNSLSTQEELHPTPAAQNIKSIIWSIQNLQVHPLGIWPRGGPWLLCGRRLALVSKSCQIIFHKLCLPHSKLFLKSTSIWFLGT